MPGPVMPGPLMRLAIIAPHFPEYALRYAAAMAKCCDVLVCIDAGQMAAEYAGRAAPAVPGGQVAPVMFRTPADLWRLARLVRRFRPDVVHLQEAAGPRRGAFLACIAAMLRRSALIVLTVHDPVPHGGRDAGVARRAAWSRNLVRRLADVLVVHGAHCARLLREDLAARRPEVPQPGLPQIVQSEHGLILEPSLVRPPQPGPLRLYFFGRMEAYKGVEVLLEAAELLHGEGLPFRLLVAGHGPELDRLQDRFQRLPEVEVRAGFAPPGEIIEAIQEVDCVVLPYLSATQSGVLAAAFAGRRFVIASAAGGIPDVVGHLRNGLLVPPGDPHALAAAIRAAGDEGLRAQLRDGAAETAQGQLDWDRIGRELHATFMAAVAERRAARMARAS